MLSKFNWTGYLELQHVLNRLSSHVITEQAGSEQAIFSNLELQQVLELQQSMLAQSSSMLNQSHVD